MMCVSPLQTFLRFWVAIFFLIPGTTDVLVLTLYFVPTTSHKILNGMEVLLENRMIGAATGIENTCDEGEYDKLEDLFVHP